jgi:Conjugative transposon protein TcpC
MVRRAILDPDDTLAAEDQALPPSQFPAEPVRPAGRQWHGAGGRWLVWVGRVIAWAVLLLIGYRGVLAIVTGAPAARSPAAAAPSASARAVAFSDLLAEAYALQFGDVYLNFSPADAGHRSQELARYLASGTNPQLGWNGAGTERLQSEQVAGINVTSTHRAVVTLLASLSGGRLIELAVPIYASQGGMSVSGEPALLPAPSRAAASAGQQTADPSAESSLGSQLPAFFAAYATGDRTTLARFTTPGSHITGLGGAVAFGSLDGVFAPPGGAQRTVTATVTWKLTSVSAASGTVTTAPAALQVTYQLTVLRQGNSWDVQSIGPATTTQVPS